MNIRRTVRDVHRRGTEDYAVVEGVGVDTATVRLTIGGKRLTNLPVISTVEAGDQVIVDYSTGKPYVRPVTLADDEVVLELGGDTTGEITQSETGRLWVMTGNDQLMSGNHGVVTVRPDGYYIPNLTLVDGDGEVSACPYYRTGFGSEFDPYGKTVAHLATPGKYIMSTSFDVVMGPNLGGLSLPLATTFGIDYYAFWITSFPWSGGQTDPPRGTVDYLGRQRRYMWWKSTTDVKAYHNSSVIVTEQPDTWAYPEIVLYRPYHPFTRTWPYASDWCDYTISNVRCSIMLIAKLSDKPRSTLGSHWDEWYERYPEYI
jgi:hypothetical protein